MKKCLIIFFILFVLVFIHLGVEAQCAMCTKTASQLGEKPALGMNQGILYLMGAPFAIVGFIAYRWWKSQKEEF
ncbi:MAG: hypothetical protein WD135_05515 [Ferruginibacter sp.]